MSMCTYSSHNREGNDRVEVDVGHKPGVRGYSPHRPTQDRCKMTTDRQTHTQCAQCINL